SAAADFITRDNTLSVSGSVLGVSEGTPVFINVMNGSNVAATLTGSVGENGNFTTNTSGVLASLGAAGTEYTFLASVTDANGNIVTDSFDVTVDRATTEATVGLASGSNSGATNDGITNDTTPDFSGFAEAGATVDVFLNGDLIGTTVAGNNGAYTLTFAEADIIPLTDGTYTLSTISTDVAGNIKPSAQGTSFTVDTLAPEVASITAADTSLNV
ncbi:hypothetical protein IPV08_24345, partial [Methylobacterium sp. SD274]|uniref:Ig-like domain-containing protein n=1 Tax=Methylobacterium sp. SD274 TaxID=2782009 RepID=UPI001FEE7B37